MNLKGKTRRSTSLFGTSATLVEKAAQMEKSEERMRHLAEELSARKRSVAKKRQTEGAVAVKEK